MGQTFLFGEKSEKIHSIFYEILSHICNLLTISIIFISEHYTFLTQKYQLDSIVPTISTQVILRISLIH